jgi:hypothetical protein
MTVTPLHARIRLHLGEMLDIALFTNFIPAMIAIGVFVAAVVLAGCGDNACPCIDAGPCRSSDAATPDDASHPDAPVDAMLPDAPADDRVVDAGVSDAGPDAGTSAHPACTVRGTGAHGTQCCIWDPQACQPGLGCYWNPDNHHGPNEGVCAFPERAPPIPPSQACDQMALFQCTPGAFCLALLNDSFHSYCRVLCNPSTPGNPLCPGLEQCVYIEGIPNIGFCGGDL